MLYRREFFKKLTAAAGALSLTGFTHELFAEAPSRNDFFSGFDGNLSADNEELWKLVQQSYTNSSNLINLNNGGVSPQPKVVQEAEQRYLQLANEAPSYYMWRLISKEIETIRERLAKLGGCSSEEIALNRNTTEAIQTVLLGIDWRKGDEIVCTEQDYSTVKVGWDWLERRFGVIIKKIDLKLPFESEDYYVETMLSAFSSRTKLVNITHIINWCGQTVPVNAIRRVCDEARNRGIFSLVDGAHSFAQLVFKIPDLGCDAYTSSLHKWLGAPFGNGLLYIKKDKISKLWSLMPSSEKENNSITKFEHLGTRSLASIAAIGKAIDFHEMIGAELKLERLLYLRNYWIDKIKSNERIRLFNSHKKEFSSVIALIGIEGVEPNKVEEILFNKFMIHTVNINMGTLKGVRISPNVYTKISDLERLLESLNYVIKNH